MGELTGGEKGEGVDWGVDWGVSNPLFFRESFCSFSSSFTRASSLSISLGTVSWRQKDYACFE